MRRVRRSISEVPANGPVFVDSGGWIAYFSRRDDHHDEAERMIRAAVERSLPLLTTNLVIAETHRLLLFRAGVAAAARMLDVLERTPHLSTRFATAADHTGARRWIAGKEGRKITLTDAVSFAVMTEVKSRGFIGFDGDFDAAGFARFQV